MHGYDLLDPMALPDFAGITPEAITMALDRAIDAHETIIATAVAARPTDFAELWLPLERASIALDALWSAVSHLHGVADTPALRAAHADGQARLVEHAMNVAQNRDLFDLLTALLATPAFALLPLADRVAVEHAIRSFTLAGVALAPEQRSRFGAIAVELSTLSNAFGSAVLDATEAWSELITDATLLAGIPDAGRAMFREAAAAHGQIGWRISLQQPSINAILTFAEDRGLRARVYRAAATRASDQGPQAGEFDNGPRITRILALRHEAARLLGFADPVAWSLATKMAPDASAVLAFLRDLARRARPAAMAATSAVATNGPTPGMASSRRHPSSVLAIASTAAVAPATPTTDAAKPMLDPDRDPNAQSRKLDFVATSDRGGPSNPHALTVAASPNTLSAGSVIAASLITGLRSDLPGLVTAQVTERVYDSATGRILLIPQGARLIGSYDSVVAFGQRRALVVWQRIILPDGSSLALDNVPATDAAGYAGLADKVDFHIWSLLKGVALSTLLGVGSSLTFTGESDLVQAIRESTQQNVSRAGDQLTSRNLQVRPTITVRPGAIVRLVVHKDLILAPWRS